LHRNQEVNQKNCLKVAIDSSAYYNILDNAYIHIKDNKCRKPKLKSRVKQKKLNKVRLAKDSSKSSSIYIGSKLICESSSH